MRSVFRRAVAVLMVGFVVGGVAARWPAAIVAAQTDPSASPTPPPTVTGSKVTAAPTTAAPRPATTAPRTPAPAPTPASAAPGTKTATASAAVTVPAPTTAAPSTAAPTAAEATTVAVTTASSTTASTITTTAAAAATPSSPPSTAGIGDAEASRRVRRISWTLVALAGGLFALTLWFWRTTRPVSAELGGLAVMGTRRWRRAPAPRRDELVTGSRPARLGNGDELFVDPADVPALALRDASPFDALETSSAELAPTVVPDAWAGADVASMVDVLPGAGPMLSVDVASFPTSSATTPPAPVPPPPVAVPAAVPAAVPNAQPLEPTADPAHLIAHSSAAVVSPPGSLVSEGSATGASLLPPTATQSRAAQSAAPAMPVELSPAIDGLSPLVEVVPAPEPGFVALEPIPADQFASGQARDSAAQ